jgi:ribosomal protein S18 acetylase RimI-like enzyme
VNKEKMNTVANFHLQAYNLSGANMNIRYGTIADAEMLSELGARTFFDTFAKDNTPENTAAHLKASFSTEIQVKELSAPENIFLIAETDGNPIGFAQLILASRDEALKGSHPLEIRRIYASQDQIGKGVGKALMQAAINEAKQRGCDSIWLGVWEKNPRAIEFYKKWGFKEVGSHIFKVGDDPQRDFIMELMLA